MPVARLIGLDAGTMRLLLDALEPSYDPGIDASDTAVEKVALVRCFAYGTCIYHLVPSVTKLLIDRPPPGVENSVRRTIFLLSDGSWQLGEDGSQERVGELRSWHDDAFTCAIVAEAETARIAVLLTCDSCLVSDLESHTQVKLLRPSDFWAKLKIPPGSPALWFPAAANHLRTRDWWRI